MVRVESEELGLSAGARRIVQWVEKAMRGGVVDWSRIVHEVVPRDVWPLVSWATQRLDDLPFYAVLFEDDEEEELARRALERFLGELLNREGNSAPLIRVLRREFLSHGAPAFDLLLRLCTAGRPIEAAVLLARSRGMRRDSDVELDAVAANMPATPPGIVGLVERLVAEPCELLWRGLSKHLPVDDVGLFAELLVDLGADRGDLLRAAAGSESPAGLGRLVDTGIFAPDLIVPIAREAERPGVWFALAARAAQAQGYEVRCVELAARALGSGASRDELRAQLDVVWQRADGDMRLALASVGVPFPAAEEASGELAW